MGMSSLIVAHERYERHLPMIEGPVAPLASFSFEMLEVGQEGTQRHGRHRHERMLRSQEFDIAEVSLSSYLMAKDHGRPLTAVPVFPRCLFSQTQMFVSADSPVRSPQNSPEGASHCSCLRRRSRCWRKVISLLRMGCRGDRSNGM